VDREEVKDRVLGSVVGASIGDALGGAFEVARAEYILEKTGKDWIDDMWGYRRFFGPFGVWVPNAPAGLGTDDTRMNHVFLETVVENAGTITSHRLAMAYIDRYLHPERYYPKEHEKLARGHFADFFGVSCGYLGMECPLYPGVPTYALRERSFGCRFPTLIGLLGLACSGTLYVNQPVVAYRKAFECAYFDVGYAREACGLLAAAVSMAVGGISDAGRILSRVARLDPFQFATGRFGSTLKSVVETASQLAKKAKASLHLVQLLAAELAGKHKYDPIDTLTVCFAANLFADGDPRTAITIACNHRNVDEEGNLVKFRDNDCTGYVAGALAGAISGFKKLPAEWAAAVLKTNKEIYGLDIEKNVEEYWRIVYGEG
jgi:ADP-ribosylglycohydrolase